MLAKKEVGNAKLKEKDFEAAVIAYQEAVDLCTPAMAEAGAAVHSNLSLATLKLGNAEEALTAADAAIAGRPKWEKGHFRRGEALFALRRYDEAEKAYALGLECKPTDADLSFAKKLAAEASKGGVWFRQISPGRDVAISPTSQLESLVFGAAKQMRNFIYLVGCAATRECYCFDPAWDTRGLAGVAERHKMRLVGAMGTHFHFDHIGGTVPAQLASMVYGPFGKPKDGDGTMVGLREMKTDFGCKLYAQSTEVAMIAKQINVSESELTPLEQGTVLPLGTAGKLVIMHTPGHSYGSICIHVQPAASSGEQLILSGDTIFPGSCGRLDFEQSSKDSMFETLQKLRTLDDNIKVYPGHGYSGDWTTIGKEKAQGLLRPFTKEMFKQMFG